MRVHRNSISEGKPMPGAFRNRGNGMSTDWSRYSTPVESQARASTPSDNGIISLGVGSVRAIGQIVDHTPIPTNRAHTDVVGEKTVEVRLKLLREFRWEIGPPSQAL